MKNSKDILKEPAFVLCLERHKDVRYFPTKERLNKAGFENIYPFKAVDGAYAGENFDHWSSGIQTLGEYLFDMPVKKGHYTTGGQFGVFASFLSLWRYLACSNLDGIFIFEDDALPRPDFKEVFPLYWDSVEDDVDVIFLGGGSYEKEVRDTFINKFGSEMISENGLIWKGQLDCLHAYYLTRSGAKKLLSMYENIAQYDSNDPLLEDHFKNNMYWFKLSKDASFLEPSIDSNQHSDVYKNLQTNSKQVIEFLELSCGEEGLAINSESNKNKLDNCFLGNNKIFNQNLRPRLQKEHYIADGFTAHILRHVDDNWTSLRGFMSEKCKNFKSAAFIGDATSLTKEYQENEIPWRDCGIIHQNAYQDSSIHGTDLVGELFRLKKAEPDIPKASHIFLIGLDRCGSNSLLEFLGTSIPVKYDDKGRIGSRMAFNFFNAHKILKGLEDEIPQLCAYGNMQAIFLSGEEKLGGNSQRDIPIFIYRLFKELYTQYPDAKFIFNTRHWEQWIEGRRRIGDGYMMDYYQRCSKPELCGTPEWTEKTIEEVQKDWKKTFENHTQEVRDFFADKQDHRFLEFNISTDHPQKIVDFLPELDLNIQNAWEIRENWGPHSQ